MRRGLVVLGVLSVLLPLAARGEDDTPSRREIERQHRKAIAKLPEPHQRWLAEIHPVLTPEEKAAFLSLGVPSQRARHLGLHGEEPDQARDAALGFLRRTIRPRDRAAVVTFNDHPNLGAKLVLYEKKLSRFSEETGGRAFYLNDAADLPGIYAAIKDEVRSQYLIAYQSTNTGGGNVFRAVELEVEKPGVEVKTMRGYYPWVNLAGDRG